MQARHSFFKRSFIKESMHMSVHLSEHMFVHMFVNMSVHISVHMSGYMPMQKSVNMGIYALSHLEMCMRIFVPVHGKLLRTHMCTCEYL